MEGVFNQFLVRGVRIEIIPLFESTSAASIAPLYIASYQNQVDQPSATQSVAAELYAKQDFSMNVMDPTKKIVKYYNVAGFNAGAKLGFRNIDTDTPKGTLCYTRIQTKTTSFP